MKKKADKISTLLKVFIAVITIIFIAAIAVTIIVLSKDGLPEETNTTIASITETTAAPESETIQETTTVAETTTETVAEITEEAITEAATEAATEATTEAPSEAETASEAEPVTEPVTAATDAPAVASSEYYDLATATGVTWDNVVFIGDSRTLSMAHGGDYEFALVPDDSVCAAWGGQLTDQSAFDLATIAGAKQRKAAIFWYGINDIHRNPNRDDANGFIENYKKVIEAFETYNNGVSKLYFVSILPSTNLEAAYYDGQNENIIKYNTALIQFCNENGYTYLDASGLLVNGGNGCWSDAIHFNAYWYTTYFLPFIAQHVGGIAIY